jgi:hypothetical protein
MAILVQVNDVVIRVYARYNSSGVHIKVFRLIPSRW